jgi:hypothetical protein
MRANPAPEVTGWFAGMSPFALFTTALTKAEGLFGIA